MLKPVGAALTAWAPVAYQDDPVAVIASVWNRIVGAELGRMTAPVQVERGCLVVVTRSSAWNAQLAFLAEEIVEKVRADAGVTTVERVRFRVGNVRERRQFAQPLPAHRRAPARRSRAPLEPAESLDEAVMRFRRHVAERQRAKRAAGWKSCTRCGVPIETAEECPPCAGALREARARVTSRLMFEAPWLGYEATATLVDGLTESEYETTRSRLLTDWWETLARAKRLRRAGNRERLVASSYVLLKTRWDPDHVTPTVVRNILGDELHALLFAPPSIDKGTT